MGNTPPSAPRILSQVHQIRVGSQFTCPMQGLKAGLLLNPCQFPIPSFNLSLQFLDPMLAAELFLQIAQTVCPPGHACTHNTHLSLQGTSRFWSSLPETEGLGRFFSSHEVFLGHDGDHFSLCIICNNYNLMFILIWVTVVL